MECPSPIWWIFVSNFLFSHIIIPLMANVGLLGYIRFLRQQWVELSVVKL